MANFSFCAGFKVQDSWVYNFILGFRCRVSRVYNAILGWDLEPDLRSLWGKSWSGACRHLECHDGGWCELHVKSLQVEG